MKAAAWYAALLRYNTYWVDTMKYQKAVLSWITVLTALAGCSERGSVTVPRQDVRVLAGQLNSEDQTIRDNAAKMLLRVVAPMQEYVERNQPDVLKVPLAKLLSRFDETVRNAAQVIVHANPQASKHIYIFQAYCWPQYPMTRSRGDFLRFIRPPENHTAKWAYWHRNGTLAIEETYENGKLHGATTHWGRTGNKHWKRQEMVYEHGKVVSSVEWNEKGQERFRTYWEDGAYHDIRTAWHENGTREGVSVYKNSKQHGTLLRWYESDQKWTEENWQDGKRHGILTVWHRNGQMMHTGQWRQGRQHGFSMAWFKNGQKQREENYESGELKGRQTVWDWKGNVVSEKQW